MECRSFSVNPDRTIHTQWFAEHVKHKKVCRAFCSGFDTYRVSLLYNLLPPQASGLSRGNLNLPYPSRFYWIHHLTHSLPQPSSSVNPCSEEAAALYICVPVQPTHARFPMSIPLARQAMGRACTLYSSHFSRSLSVVITN